MGARQVNLLEMVLAGPGESCCVVVPDDRAEACIIDLDSSGAGEELFRQRDLHPGRPLMLTALHRPPDAVVGPDLFVPKPLGVDALIETVTALYARVHAPEGKVRIPATSPGPVAVSGPVGAVSETDPEQVGRRVPLLPPGAVAPPRRPFDPASQGDAGQGRPRTMRVGSARADAGARASEPERVTGPDGARMARMARICTYEPAHYLQGLVVRAHREALRRGCAVHLEGPWPTITLLPASGTAVVSGGAECLRPFSPQYDLPSHGRATFTPAPLFSPNHPDAVALEGVIWELALGAAAGRVPDGTQLDAPCALQDWPDFTRLAPVSGAMSIAALWTRQAVTLEETARTLQVPLREVCGFYSAAHAVGLIAPVTDVAAGAAGTAGTAGVSPQASSLRHGLLRRVFEKLYIM